MPVSASARTGLCQTFRVAAVDATNLGGVVNYLWSFSSPDMLPVGATAAWLQQSNQLVIPTYRLAPGVVYSVGVAVRNVLGLTSVEAAHSFQVTPAAQLDASIVVRREAVVCVTRDRVGLH